jgi:MFS family permease
MSRARLLLATVVAYLPAGALAPLAEDAPGGALDPSALVVPFCLGFAVGFVAWGRIADRFAPGAVVRVALLLTAAAGLLVALAPSEELIVIGRLLTGLAAAGVPPAVQSALAASADDGSTGRAMSPMMLAVAVAVFVGPALAPIAGWTLTTVALLTAQLGVAAAPVSRDTQSRSRRRRRGADTGDAATPYQNAPGVYAGWIVSATVLAGHWTVLTRLTESPGDESITALTGVVGLPLVVLAARASDAVGPKRTMTATLLAGAAGFALASTAGDAVLFTLSAGVGLAVYWAYLPVVAAQVQRSAGEHARGRAAGGLYASMWGSAAAAGAIAGLAPGWREVLLGAGILWAIGAVVAARAFLGASAPCLTPAPQPSPR